MSGNGRTLIRLGIGGAIVAGLCCATPLLAIALTTLGLSAWLAYADYVLLPAILTFMALAALGLYLRRHGGAAHRKDAS